MNSTEVATRDPLQDLVSQVNAKGFSQQIAAALPGNVSPQRFVRVTTTALRENPDLVNVDRASLFSAIVRCAQDGLLPDSREAALVTFKDKKKGQVAVYMPMIGGFRKIAAEFGWSLQTRVVYENDTFEVTLGAHEGLQHIPTRPGLERGAMVCAYAVATHKDGRKEIEVVHAEDVEKARKVSRASGYGPWVEWPERMWEKTAGRRLFAKLPLDSAERARAVSVIQADELKPGDAAAILYGPDKVSLREDGTSTAEEATDNPEAHEDPPASSSEAEVGTSAAEPVSEEPIEDGEFTVPASVDQTDPDIMAANTAAAFPLPVGKHKGLTLGEVVDNVEDGVGYLRYLLRQWKTEPLKGHAWAYARVYAPDVYEEVLAQEADSE